MIRCALVLIALLLASMGGWSEPVAPQVGAQVSVAQGGDDCCPQPPDADEGDCCATDLGKCCGNGIVHLAPRLGLPRPVWAGADAADALPVPHLHPRATGPPPTPPPIA